MVLTPFLALGGCAWPHDLEDGSSRCQTYVAPQQLCWEAAETVVVGGRRILAQRAGF